MSSLSSASDSRDSCLAIMVTEDTDVVWVGCRFDSLSVILVLNVLLGVQARKTQPKHCCTPAGRELCFVQSALECQVKNPCSGTCARVYLVEQYPTSGAGKGATSLACRVGTCAVGSTFVAEFVDKEMAAPSGEVPLAKFRGTRAKKGLLQTGG